MTGRPPPEERHTLTVGELGQLSLAGRWGLLRPQSGCKYAFAGKFSMPLTDMVRLVEAAGGRFRAGLALSRVDVLVAGEDADPSVLELARREGLPVWDEARLVEQLWPLPATLVTPEGEPPF